MGARALDLCVFGDSVDEVGIIEDGGGVSKAHK